jgi:hypothetical protein
MGFQDRLDDMRCTQAEAARTQAEADVRARGDRQAAARKRARALLPELDEAVEALRADHERSLRQLMSHGKTGDRYSGSIGAMLTSFRATEPRHPWWRRPTVRDRLELAGWWVRYRSTDQAPFEFEVPLCGQATVGRYRNHVSSGPKWTFEVFADGALYEYERGGGEYGPCETKEIAADEVCRNFLSVVTGHLLRLAR